MFKNVIDTFGKIIRLIKLSWVEVSWVHSKLTLMFEIETK